MSSQTVPKSELLQMTGWESEPGDWFTITQERVNQFADATLDHQFIHIDAERAAQTPLGGTIVHGFLTLSLLPYLSEGLTPTPENLKMAFNYGLNKVRFPAPVRVGSDVRLRWKIQNIAERMGRIIVTAQATIEVKGGNKPAMVAETVTMFVVE